MAFVKGLSSVLALLALSLGFAASASAQATRTWISGVGDDANPCSRTAPCKTFAGAISKTAARGEIDCLDPGGFGAVTITKAITLDCAGGMSGQAGGILSAGTTGVIINVGVNDRVVIRNLVINGVGTGFSGIRVIGAGSLTIEHVVLIGVGAVNGTTPTPAVDVRPSIIRAKLFMRDVEIHHAGSTGINLSNASATLEDLFISGSGSNALQVGEGAIVTVNNSSFTGSGSKGVIISAVSLASEVNLEGVQLTHNLGQGVLANGAVATARLSNCGVYANATGLEVFNSASIVSFGNNRVAGNGNNGSATTAAMPQ